MFNVFVQCFFIFFATIGFSILFSIKKEELLYCGVVGVISFLFYDILILNEISSFVGAIVGTFVAVVISRRLAFVRRIPVAVYIIPSIIPLVPGSAIYLAMYNIISRDNYNSIYYAFEAIKITSGIVIGISVALSLPSKWFRFKKLKEKG